MNELWSEFKTVLIDLLKFLILVIVMTVGFWAIYKWAWVSVGLPETTWHEWALLGLAGYSEYCYCCLISDY